VAKTLDQLTVRTEFIATRSLVTAQAIAGSLFTVFLAIHLINTLMALAGVEDYNQFQTAAQVFYQQPLIEFLFVALPLLIHAYVGVVLLMRKRKKGLTLQWKQRLNSWAGIFLLLVVFGHIAATRGIALFNDIDTGFAALSFSIWWMPAYFIPYYFLLFMAGWFHGYNGVARLTNRINRSVSAMMIRAKPAVMTLSAVLVAISLLSFAGLRYEIPDPTDSDYARVYAELFNINLER